MGISSLDSAAPLSSAPASEGAAELRALKDAVKTSFPGFTASNDICTLTGPQIDALSSSKQPLDATLTALAGLNSSTGLVEQTGADTFTKRSIGAAASTDILTRAAGDGRYGELATANVWTASNDFYGNPTLINDLQAYGTAAVPTVATTTNDDTAASTSFVRNAVGAYAHQYVIVSIPYGQNLSSSISGANLTVQTNAENDPQNVFSLNASSVTCSEAGRYRIDYSLPLYNIPSSCAVGIAVDGTVIATTVREITGTGTTSAEQSGTYTVSLSAGQQVSLKAYSSGGAASIDTSGALLGPSRGSGVMTITRII